MQSRHRYRKIGRLFTGVATGTNYQDKHDCYKCGDKVNFAVFEICDGYAPTSTPDFLLNTPLYDVAPEG